MRRRCEKLWGGDPHEYCGVIFDDEVRSSVCPHLKLEGGDTVGIRPHIRPLADPDEWEPKGFIGRALHDASEGEMVEVALGQRAVKLRVESLDLVRLRSGALVPPEQKDLEIGQRVVLQIPCPDCGGIGGVVEDSMTLYGIPGGQDWARCAGGCDTDGGIDTATATVASLPIEIVGDSPLWLWRVIDERRTAIIVMDENILFIKDGQIQGNGVLDEEDPGMESGMFFVHLDDVT